MRKKFEDFMSCDRFWGSCMHSFSLIHRKPSGWVILSLLSAIALLASCSGGTNAYHVGRQGWDADSIYLRVYKTSDSSARPGLPKMTVECRSCNLVNEPSLLNFDEQGIARIYIPEAPHLISARLHVHGHGIDTSFIQKQRPPQEAVQYYKLSQPLTGRVLVDHFALLYSDTTQDSVIANAQLGDEMNIFGEHSVFYLVHHPLFSNPLYLLKEDALRLY